MTRRMFQAMGSILFVLCFLLALPISADSPPATADETTADEEAAPPAEAAGQQAQDGAVFPIPIPEAQRSFPQFATTRVDDVVLAVGFQVAQIRMKEGSEYLPLVLGMQNFKHKMWNVKLKDFQLYDQDGNLIEPVPLKEIRANYKRYPKDYEFVLNTTTINQILPNAEFAGGVSMSPSLKFGTKGGIDKVDDGRTFYGHSLYYPTPGSTAVYSTTLDYKNFFIDILFYKGIEGKWLRLVVPEKKRRPALELVFRLDPVK